MWYEDIVEEPAHLDALEEPDQSDFVSEEPVYEGTILWTTGMVLAAAGVSFRHQRAHLDAFEEPDQRDFVSEKPGVEGSILRTTGMALGAADASLRYQPIGCSPFQSM